MKEYQNIAKMLHIIPRMMKHFEGGFGPDKDLNLKKTEMKTLMRIKDKPRQSMKFYNRSVNIESGSFTYLANKLEQKGYINRVPSEEDGRSTVLELTEKGHCVTDAVLRHFEERVMQQIACLDAQDISKLKKATEILENILRKMES